MSLVSPFRARVYRHEPGADLSAFAAPPYDVVTPQRRSELLAAEPHNVVALELPDGPLDAGIPGNRYETGRALWTSWYDEGVLVDDDSPAIYVARTVLGVRRSTHPPKRLRGSRQTTSVRRWRRAPA